MTTTRHPTGAPLADEHRVGAYLDALADEPAARMPSAAQLRWRADVLQRLAAREAHEQRVTRPLRWTVIAALTLIGLGLSVWGTISLAGDGSSVQHLEMVLGTVLGWLPALFGGAWALRVIARS